MGRTAAATPEGPQGPQELLLLEGLVGAPGDHVLYDVQTKLLPGGPHSAGQGGGRDLAASHAGDGGGPGRSRMLAVGVVDAFRCPSQVGHEEEPGILNKNRREIP
jgi:hypothetical protein